MESQAGILQAQMSDLVLMLGTGAQSGGKKKKSCYTSRSISRKSRVKWKEESERRSLMSVH